MVYNYLMRREDLISIAILVMLFALASCSTTAKVRIGLPVITPGYEAEHPGQTLASQGRGDHNIDPDFFSAFHHNYAVAIKKSGKGVLMTPGVGYLDLALPMPDGVFHLEGLYFAEVERGFFIAYGVLNDDVGASRTVLLGKDGKEVLWYTQVQGYNPGNPLIYEGHAYLSATGFVGKLSLATGEFAWRHEGIRHEKHDGSFSSFELPVIEAGKVYFIERCNKCEQRMMVRVDDGTGEFEVLPFVTEQP